MNLIQMVIMIMVLLLCVWVLVWLLFIRDLKNSGHGAKEVFLLSKDIIKLKDEQSSLEREIRILREDKANLIASRSRGNWAFDYIDKHNIGGVGEHTADIMKREFDEMNITIRTLTNENAILRSEKELLRSSCLKEMKK